MNLRESLDYILSNWSMAVEEKFADHYLAGFFRNDFCEIVRRQVKSFDSDWIVRASAGSGNWANVPWLAVFNPKITSGAQDGIYPVYLFCGDASGVFLTLAQGVTEPAKKFGKHGSELRANQIKEIILEEIPGLASWDSSPLDLKATTDLGRSYEKSNIAAKFYSADAIPDEASLTHDLMDLLIAYKKVESIEWRPERRSVTQNVSDNFKAVSLSKPFLLLSGISGTGKSRFIREQARQHNLNMANFCLIAVRPDWHEPSDLLGYVSRLSGAANYVPTDVLRFMVAAWKALHDQGLRLSGSNNLTRLNGASDQLDAVAPYWLCLDEMNLAPVEQYFADYLSLIETREWQHDGEYFTYRCDAMLKAGVLDELNTAAQRELASALGLGGTAPGEADHALWQHFLAHGMAIPPNLIVAGTVNMDETTHGFSRKVIDRAMSFDFGEFFPNVFDDFYKSETSHVTLTFPRHASGRQAISKDEAQPSIVFLQAVNGVLEGSPFELAYRALNELLLAVYCHGSPLPGPELQAVWDDFLMQKVLPRIEGDADKLQGKEDDNLLSRLHDLLENQLVDIWSEGKSRPDFYRLQVNKPMQTDCRSRRKISWMQDRLASSGFTSFWP